jgi:general secretion pathway protein G
MKKAFTIIELLVVIVLLGILIGIAVPKIKGFQQNGNLTKAQREVVTLETALESYYTFTTPHAFPPSDPAVQTNYLINFTPKMVNNIAYDPFGATSTTEYNYLCSQNGLYYVVFSKGLSGQDLPVSISNTGVITYQ